jgi:hypothetical protein
MKTTVAYCHGKKSSVHHQSGSIRKTNEKKRGRGGGGGANVELWICHLKRTRIKKLLFYVVFLELNIIFFSSKIFFYTFFHF